VMGKLLSVFLLLLALSAVASSYRLSESRMRAIAASRAHLKAQAQLQAEDDAEEDEEEGADLEEEADTDAGVEKCPSWPTFIASLWSTVDAPNGEAGHAWKAFAEWGRAPPSSGLRMDERRGGNASPQIINFAEALVVARRTVAALHAQLTATQAKGNANGVDISATIGKKSAELCLAAFNAAVDLNESQDTIASVRQRLAQPMALYEPFDYVANTLLKAGYATRGMANMFTDAIADNALGYLGADRITQAYIAKYKGCTAA